MNRKRRIIADSDSEDSMVALETPAVSKAAAVPVVSLQSRMKSSVVNDDPRSSDSDGEWKPADINEVMHGAAGGDGKEAVPRRISAEQIGDHGIEYQVLFQNGEGSKKYHEWIAETDLTDDMKLLKDQYEDNLTTSNRRNQKKSRPSYAEQMNSGSDESEQGWESGDEGEDAVSNKHQDSDGSEESESEARQFSSARRGSKGSREKSNSRSRPTTDSSTAPAVLRRSTRSSSTTRKMITRQKLDDLMELRQRSKHGIGALHDVSGSSSDDDDIHTYSATAATPALFGSSARNSPTKTGGRGGSRSSGAKKFIAGGGSSRARCTEKYESAEEEEDLDNFIVNSDEEDVYAVYDDPASERYPCNICVYLCYDLGEG
jgi:hypothetical protein